MLWLKSWSARRTSNHSVFMGKWLTVISLPPSRKWGCGVSARFHLAVFAIGVNQEKWKARRVQDYNTNGGKLLCRPSSGYKKLLDRVTFWIVHITLRVGYKIVAFNATSVGVGRRNYLFVCMCSRNCIELLLLSILLCILL